MTDPLEAALTELEQREQRADVRVADAQRELDAATAEMNAARVAREAIENLLGRVPKQVTAPPPERRRVIVGAPEGMEAVEQALRASQTPLTLAELTRAVARLGWHPETANPQRAVRAAANRLRRKSVDFDYIAKRFAYMPIHGDQLPQRIGGVGDFIDDEGHS